MLNTTGGALPARFRRTRLLIVGCGDVGTRVARRLAGRVRLLALTSTPARVPALRALGVTPLVGDLDEPPTLRRLAGLAQRVLHLAPPPSQGLRDWRRDPRSRALAAALARRSVPHQLVYGSTSGVYGDCGGAWVDETRAPDPRTPRAWRRLDAERTWRLWGRQTGARVTLLRIPGIYAPDRPGGAPQRLLGGLPVLRREDDVVTNHIHADDLARACVRALWLGRPQRVVNVVDDTQLPMGDCLDRVADLLGLPRPPRLSRAEAQGRLPLAVLSFMDESRRLRNQRLKRELRLRLRYPSVEDGWAQAAASWSRTNQSE
ncbi:NAD dependent epimerase/dehydratase family protein [Tepidimonas sediminis]|uniref:NAD dependent epimerase/dehydratase family protein n=1 Tax=Tepidimonas sediminis TaxID=2588941 RepID=A0A554WRF4_9BURK|nr:NAD-dependent epimerase/dehydratase family protein [Tepidimonas sediminis]TSE26147.1 NAD dependent epimerase/dehydratase family protein [Tepidimonas sediminis]